MKEGWEYKKLGEVLVFDKRFNGIPKEKQPRITQFTHVSAEVLKNLKTENGEVKLLSTGLFSAHTTVELAKDYINEGEVVTIPTGGVANIKYYKGKFVDSGNILGVSSGPDVLLKYVYLGMIANKELINSYYRGVSIKHPYMPDIYNIIIPVPSLSEQQRIVEELDLLSSIIEKKKEQLKELDNLAQSIFYDMFGDPVTNEKGWEVKTLKDVCNKITDGTHDTPQRLDKGVKFITGKHIRPYFVDYDNSDYVTEEVHKEIYLRCNPEYGDVLYTNIGAGIGNAAINTVEYEFSMKNVALLKLHKSVAGGYFIEFYLNNEKIKTSIIENFSNGGAQKFLSLKSIAKIHVSIPPLALQQQFASKIEVVEKQKELIKQSIKEVETLFNCRMDYYFN